VRIVFMFIFSFLLMGLVSCNGTTVGNPVYSEGAVTIGSSSYSNSVPAANKVSSFAAVTDFKFCITKVSLKDDSGSEVNGGSLDLNLGLVDVSDSTAAKSWGEADIPVGYSLSEMNIEVHKDSELCGVDYSLRYNNVTIEADLEFKFKFDPAIVLSGGDQVLLNLSAVASAIERASVASALTDELIHSHLEGVEGEGSEED